MRTEGLVLLNDLSRSSTELQKLFVFENAFDKVFDMIEADGSLTQGSIIVQDCLSLLANLVRFNSSNQTTFRETGGVARFAQLLPGGPKKKKPRTSAEEEDDWVSPQADKNIWGLLAILRMFLVKGSTSTLPNQNAFHKHGLLQQALNMAFDPNSAVPIKVEALNTCADIIRGNSRIQEGFAQLQVRPLVAPNAANGLTSPNADASVYIIDALLDLALTPAANELFDLRFAACECIKAYFFNHIQIRTHFLKRAIGGHIEGGDETANALTTLVTGSQGAQTIDPYRTWFASTLIFHLIFEDLEAKNILMSVAEGDAESGEEVVTCIQTLTANLIGSLQLGEDERISIAYLMILSAWLFEDAAAVNDFLGEASSLQSLVQAASKQGDDHVVTRGLCAALLGIIYEFSTKDSPIPRRDLQPILTSTLGREKYLNAIKELRHHPLVRDFEVIPQTGLGSSLPDVYFDETFIDFLKDNFSRLSRAIDRDPVIEIHQSDQGIDRDLVDSLRGQIEEKNQAIEKHQADILTLDQKLSQEQADHRRTQESSLSQISAIKKVNEDLQRNHENDLRRAEREHKQHVLELENRQNLQLSALNNKLQQSSKDATIAVAKTKQEYEDKLHEAVVARTDLEKRLTMSDRARKEALETVRGLEQTQKHTRGEIATITATLGNLQTHVRDSEAQIKQLQDDKAKLEDSVTKLKSENQELKTKAQDQTWKVKDAEEKLRKAEASIKDKEEKLRKAEASIKDKEEARAAAQTELDDLFVVLGDLEEKRTRDKVGAFRVQIRLEQD